MVIFFFQAEDGIRDLVRSRGLGDVYKRQVIFSGANDLELLMPTGHTTSSLLLPEDILLQVFRL